MLIGWEQYEDKDLIGKADKVEKCREAAEIIKEYEDIIKSKNDRKLYTLSISKVMCLKSLKRRRNLLIWSKTLM